jgi:hypothetical protein
VRAVGGPPHGLSFEWAGEWAERHPETDMMPAAKSLASLLVYLGTRSFEIAAQCSRHRPECAGSRRTNPEMSMTLTDDSARLL